VSGAADPQEIFLGGHAEVSGDTEKALKLAMILHAFSREFPCRPGHGDPRVEEPRS